MEQRKSEVGYDKQTATIRATFLRKNEFNRSKFKFIERSKSVIKTPGPSKVLDAGTQGLTLPDLPKERDLSPQNNLRIEVENKVDEN